MEMPTAELPMPLARFSESTLYAKKDHSLWFGDKKGNLQSLVDDVEVYPDSPVFSYKKGVFIWKNQKENNLPYLIHLAADGKKTLFEGIGFGAIVCSLPNGDFAIRSANGLYLATAENFEKISLIYAPSGGMAKSLASGYGVQAPAARISNPFMRVPPKSRR